jgi:6-pyruvoyltetrahydropterin/6-carboxytetrahydropterin synthase
MVRLGRLVRFSIDPFLDADRSGSNAYASKPAGEGLALFLELAVELTGPIDPQTGLLVNVSEIDQIARQHAVPVFVEHVGHHLRRGEHISLAATAEILRLAHESLADQFPGARVAALTLKLNPFRKLMMDAKKIAVVYLSEKFEFAATHKLWNDAFSDERNFEVFGKCANPAGHGHNYLVEVTVKADADAPPQIGRFERIVDAQLMQLVDHKNLNLDVPEFGQRIATVENLAVFAWERLAGRFDPAWLHCVTVWESDRTYCTYYGPQEPSTD